MKCVFKHDELQRINLETQLQVAEDLQKSNYQDKG